MKNEKKYCVCGREIKPCRTLYFIKKDEVCVECAVMKYFFSKNFRIVFRSWWKTATSRDGVNYGE